MFNPNDYRGQKKSVLKYFDREGCSDKTVAKYAALCGIPLTVLYTFIMEEYPEHEEMCLKSIKDLNAFMGVRND